MTVFYQIEKSLHFFAVFYKKYSESTAGNGTQQKTVIFTADIFAVHENLCFQLEFFSLDATLLFAHNSKTNPCFQNQNSKCRLIRGSLFFLLVTQM